MRVGSGDLAEHAGKAAWGLAILRKVGGLQQVLADLGPRRAGHLLDAHHQHGPGALGLDGLDRLMHGSRPGRAGILDPGCRLEAEPVARLEDQGGGEVLG
jgi:hypothetical protein